MLHLNISRLWMLYLNFFLVRASISMSLDYFSVLCIVSFICSPLPSPLTKTAIFLFSIARMEETPYKKDTVWNWETELLLTILVLSVHEKGVERHKSLVFRCPKTYSKSYCFVHHSYFAWWIVLELDSNFKHIKRPHIASFWNLFFCQKED